PARASGSSASTNDTTETNSTAASGTDQDLDNAPTVVERFWALGCDSQGRIMWLSHTSDEWVWSGSDVVQPSPLTMPHVHQVPQQENSTAWVVALQNTSSPPPQQLVTMPA
ncbi:unnamed protein product, partial [Sphacelaria rigidula]